jgi:hypothetical protein
MHKNKAHYIFYELAHHMPYSIMGVMSALILMGILTFIVQIVQSEHLLPHAAEDLFHVFHPGHILFSAVATTAMFWKHDNHSWIKAVMVGFLGSVTICGASDIIVPFFGGLLLGHEMHFHVCLIEEPQMVYPFAVVGILSGFMVTKSFDHSVEYSHSVHVFLSSVASLLYLISYGLADWTHAVGGVFLVTVFAVMFPCCFSDIVFPMLCTHRYCNHTESKVLESEK